MSESGDYDPGPWTGYDFKSARKVYDAHVGRSYDDAEEKRKKLKATVGEAAAKKAINRDLIPDMLETQSEAPLAIVCDVTGSFGEWPATIFSKLPYLEIEGKQYLGPTMEISFCAVGDQYNDQYPLQVTEFDKGLNLKNNLQKLIIEKGGGPGHNESYDLPALYYARKVKMPKAIKPIMIFIADEAPYDTVDKKNVHTLFNEDVKQGFLVEDLFEELKAKWSVYMIRKPYGPMTDNCTDGQNGEIHRRWSKILGDDHVCMLPEASRVVDVIFGILARETGQIEYFSQEIKDRQKPDQVNVVMKTLMSIHTGQQRKKPARSLSITNINPDEQRMTSKSLLD